MRNQTSFRLTTTLLPTDTTAKTTTVINKVDNSGNKFYPTFTEETVVLTNDDRTVMETTRATATNWVLTFVKRGLSDDVSETEVANRKLTWNPWTLAFITAWAWDWIDKDDDVTWTGKQTYTGELVSSNKATYNWLLETKKWVKYPSFADTTALEAYADPFGWMFATVEDTGELYRYNALTEQWDLVSTVELWQYIIRASDTEPAAWTADTIVTISPALHALFLGTSEVIRNRYVDLLIVWWWGWGWGANPNSWYGGWFAWWWWGWGVLKREHQEINLKSYTVKVGEWGSGWTSWDNNTDWENWGTSSFGELYALWGGWAGWTQWKQWANWWWWGEGGSNNWGLWLWSADYEVRDWWAFYTYGNSGWTGWTWGQWGSIKQTWGADGSLNPWLYFSICWNRYYVSEWGGWGSWHYYRDWDWYGAWATSNAIWWGWGGGYCARGNWDGAAWKDGIVVVAYPTDWSYWFSSASWGTITTATYLGKTYNVHTFTEDWTFTILS